jgi:hypothetical protein
MCVSVCLSTYVHTYICMYVLPPYAYIHIQSDPTVPSAQTLPSPGGSANIDKRGQPTKTKIKQRSLLPAFLAEIARRLNVVDHHPSLISVWKTGFWVDQRFCLSTHEKKKKKKSDTTVDYPELQLQRTPILLLLARFDDHSLMLTSLQGAIPAPKLNPPIIIPPVWAAALHRFCAIHTFQAPRMESHPFRPHNTLKVRHFLAAASARLHPPENRKR